MNVVQTPIEVAIILLIFFRISLQFALAQVFSLFDLIKSNERSEYTYIYALVIFFSGKHLFVLNKNDYSYIDLADFFVCFFFQEKVLKFVHAQF